MPLLPNAKQDDGRRSAAEDKQSYIDGYERDVLAGERRLEELEAVNEGDSKAADEARSQIAAAKEQLKRLHGHGSASKRPSGAKATRKS